MHVAATRYLPELTMRDGIGAFPYSEPYVVGRAHSTSRFVSGRDIGDELRYILDRRQGKVFPGNLLRRPSILLNPWALRDTDTDIVDAARGEDDGIRRGAGTICALSPGPAIENGRWRGERFRACGGRAGR